MGGVGDVRSRLTLEELCVDEAGRLTIASWSAKTSSRRTSESEMRGWASLKLRISTNFEGMSCIVCWMCYKLNLVEVETGEGIRSRIGNESRGHRMQLDREIERARERASKCVKRR